MQSTPSRTSAHDRNEHLAAETALRPARHWPFVTRSAPHLAPRLRAHLLLACLTLMLPLSALAADFEQCVAELKALAAETVPPSASTDALFANIEEIPRVVASDRSQPEFTQTFRDYYLRRVTSSRIDTGRDLRQTHQPLLKKIEQVYGVQAPYLLALWGLETNFGGYLGTLPVPSALATLACEGRRRDFFARQLTAVVALVARGDMQEAQLIGSWAGAMGHMQFMPTTFQDYALDADGDGRRDLYASLPDALTSAANYLSRMGWQAGWRWGREVLLPEGFDYAQAHYGNWQPLSAWRQAGVRSTNGQLVADLTVSSAILLPTGHTGPAFIIYPNFKALMQWNRSVNYALSVGRLADRIAGLGALATPLPPESELALAFDDLVKVQTRLAQLGYENGTADGVLGPATRSAIRAYQAANDLPADGYPSRNLVQHLLNTGSGD